jgi:hypothetical protein
MGRPRKIEAEVQAHGVMVRLTGTELDALDADRGDASRGEYLRQCLAMAHGNGLRAAGLPAPSPAPAPKMTDGPSSPVITPPKRAPLARYCAAKACTVKGRHAVHGA